MMNLFAQNRIPYTHVYMVKSHFSEGHTSLPKPKWKKKLNKHTIFWFYDIKKTICKVKIGKCDRLKSVTFTL